MTEMRFARDRRDLYPEASSCRAMAEGRAVAAEAMRLRTMNFGQFWRTHGIVDVEYRIEIPSRFFVDVLREELPGYVADAREFPDPGSELDRSLRACGWPSPDEVMEHPALARQLALYFAHDILLRWLGDGCPDAEAGYVLNTADEVRFDGETLVIEGKARRAGIPVVYQDV